jgi:glycosyltransferase involved in cell wall biosynthesis
VTQKNVLVIIPAWNEEESIGLVLREIQDFLPDVDILVVDDGSTDSTVKTARAHNVAVLVLPFNLGVGGARRLGYIYARDNGYQIAVSSTPTASTCPRASRS